MTDKIAEKVFSLIDGAKEPLETKEAETALNVTRTKILYRLNDLRGEGRIKGKRVGAGKGTWIWWSVKAFK